MKAVRYDAPRSFAVIDVPTPEAGPDQVRVKVAQVGVCGTDLHCMKAVSVPCTP
jgi:D-arabinitol dehydrogenase (NADP+)